MNSIVIAQCLRSKFSDDVYMYDIYCKKYIQTDTM